MRTILIGLDAFDPARFEALSEAGRLPTLTALRDRYKRFSVTNPPQSEVSWTSIATGLNPGEHGMFDFVHRNPANYALNVSLLPTKKSVGGLQFAEPHRATTIFEQAVRQGYPATSLWWPATFPAKLQSPVQTIPGLGTPDILGRLGVGFLLTPDGDALSSDAKTRQGTLLPTGRNRFSANLPGPMRKKRGQVEAVTVPLTLTLNGTQQAQLIIDGQKIDLTEGQWSPIVEMTFKGGWFFSVRAITRVMLRTTPTPALYFLPMQIHPLRSTWHYAAPPGFAKAIWRQHGAYLTIGWPQDTSGLEDGCINDDQFLRLCDDILTHRERVFTAQIRQFKEGVLACVFDTLDRVQHMFWRDRPDIVDSWYEKLDAMLARLLKEIEQRPADQWLIVSDHGFTRFDYKAHLNRWLIDQGWLAAESEASATLQPVKWDATRAYAVGLNSLYLNLAGREGQGTVNPQNQAQAVQEIAERLRDWRGSDGRPVVHQVYTRAEAFTGALSAYGPDLVIGYNAGYRGSAETGLGGWAVDAITRNTDHWGADHCVDANLVPGVIFAKRGLGNFNRPSYHSIPALAIGGNADASGSAPPPTSADDEDARILEERLKSLGYL